MGVLVLSTSRDRSVEVSSVVVPSILRLVPDFLLLALLLPSSLAVLENDSWSEGELWLSKPGGGERLSVMKSFLFFSSI